MNPNPALTRRSLLALLGVGTAGALAACTSSRSGAETTGTPADSRIRLAMLQPPRSSLNPLSDDAFKLSRWSTAETLVNLDADGNAIPALATAWERSNESTWRFTIRQNVTFHDGTALDAQRVADCLTFAAAYTTPPRILDGVELTVTADGEDVVVTTATPDPLIPQRLSSPQLVILAEAAYPAGGASDGPVDPVGHGTGPFELTAVDGTAAATLERYADYWGEPAAASGIDVTFVPEGTARGAALRTGTADLVEAVPVSQAATIDADLLHEVPMPRTATLYLNTRNGAFTDPALRAAARDAIDVEGLVETMYEGYADVAAGLLGPALGWTADKRPWGSAAWAGPDGVAAKGLAEGADLPAITAAGTVPAGTTITLGSYTDRPELAEIVVLIAQQLEAVGFTVTTDVREYSQIEGDALAGTFDAFLLSRATILDSGDPVAYMVSDFSSTGSFTLCFLADDAVDAALTRAAALEAGPERQDAIMAAEQLILASGAAVPLLHERVLQGEAVGLAGAERDPRERALITTATTTGA
ncbi:ABC transporter substrate-binding protein [Actinomyces sp. MRS3W]|uniref:ABC transporter substrate-binding protein n=1 Tax=Actinomyces sp. MRS3W TaxID=2800796 RepID=UPI0028FD7FD7|nr:ABC transporter substrate-binding protein [Actinomyces sp. MRS3W]MDU0347898.1 ABC transporter substrate-binding protein [Actinomyces sp. MRS3W]